MTEATQGQEESMNSQERGSCKLATSGSERSLPFYLQLFASVQGPGDREGTNVVREDFGPDYHRLLDKKRCYKVRSDSS